MLKKVAPGLLAIVGLISLLISSRTSANAHDDTKGGGRPSSVDEHKRTDFGFPGFRELNIELYRDFLRFDNSKNLLIAEFAKLSPAVPNSHLVGAWSPSFDLPLVPIHVMVLTNGKVLMWDSVGDNPAESYPVHNFTRASIWDPETNTVTNVNNGTVPDGGTGYNIFCAGFAHLPNGSAFLAGGNRSSALDGLNTIHFFDQTTNLWSLGPDMTYYRWYPSVTPLANGEMLITAGTDVTPHRHEVYTTANTLRILSNATLALPDYPWIQAAPEGRAFFFGPSNTMRYLDTGGTGTWGSSLPRDGINRTYGSYAMYDIGTILASGGGQSPVRRSTIQIDIANPNTSPTVTGVGDMEFARRQHNLTVLPDGTVLATGGFSGNASLVSLSTSVFDAELWNPTTRTWRTLSSATKRRQYHSTAILLPDGRVFTGGGGICGDCYDQGYLEKNMEIFSPPYLYAQDGSGSLAPRPEIVSSPDSAAYNESFFVETPVPSGISSAVLMRVSSVTHSVDFEQRRVPLKFTQAVGGLNMKAPPNSNVAPPGYYMLFLIDTAGVPSIAKMVRIEQGSDIGAPLIVGAAALNGTATIQWIPVLGATGYTVKYGTEPGVYTHSVNVGDVRTLDIGGFTSWPNYFVVSATNGVATGGDSAEFRLFGPTASGVTISGRVVTSDGRGIKNAKVTLQGVGSSPMNTTTGTFGYFSFKAVPAGQSYILSVAARRHKFDEASRLIIAMDDLSGLSFVSSGR